MCRNKLCPVLHLYDESNDRRTLRNAHREMPQYFLPIFFTLAVVLFSELSWATNLSWSFWGNLSNPIALGWWEAKSLWRRSFVSYYWPHPPILSPLTHEQHTHREAHSPWTLGHNQVHARQLINSYMLTYDYHGNCPCNIKHGHFTIYA